MGKWQDLYYLELTPIAKLLLNFMYDNVDFCGFIDFNKRLWLTQLNGNPKLDKNKKILERESFIITEKDLRDALADLQPKLISDRKQKLFIKDYLLHQHKLPLNKGNEEHKKIILKLQLNLPKFHNAPEIKAILDGVEEPIIQQPSREKRNNDSKFIAPEYKEFKEYYIVQYPDADESDIKNLYEHYVTVGWKVGSKQMKDWNSAIRKNGRNRYDKKNYGRNNSNIKQSKIENIEEANNTLDINYEELGKK